MRNINLQYLSLNNTLFSFYTLKVTHMSHRWQYDHLFCYVSWLMANIHQIHAIIVHFIITCRMSYHVGILPIIQQEAQLMLTNPWDTFRGQSRSPNMAPFHMLVIVSY